MYYSTSYFDEAIQPNLSNGNVNNDELLCIHYKRSPLTVTFQINADESPLQNASTDEFKGYVLQ